MTSHRMGAGKLISLIAYPLIFSGCQTQNYFKVREPEPISIALSASPESMALTSDDACALFVRAYQDRLPDRVHIVDYNLNNGKWNHAGIRITREILKPDIYGGADSLAYLGQLNECFARMISGSGILKNVSPSACEINLSLIYQDRKTGDDSFAENRWFEGLCLNAPFPTAPTIMDIALHNYIVLFSDVPFIKINGNRLTIIGSEEAIERTALEKCLPEN